MVYRKAGRRRFVVRSRRAFALWCMLAALFALCALVLAIMLMSRADGLSRVAPHVLPALRSHALYR